MAVVSAVWTICPGRRRILENDKEQMMKKVICVTMLACVAFVTGCGNPHEKVISQFYKFLSIGLHDAELCVAKGTFEHMDENTKSTIEGFEGRGLTVKTKVIKTFNDGNVKASAICVTHKLKDGNYALPIYYVVGCKKGGTDKIVFITEEEEEALSSGGGNPYENAERCISNMKQIVAATEGYRLSHPNTVPKLADLCGPTGYLREAPMCPKDGSTYKISVDGDDVNVSCGSGDAKHVLPIDTQAVINKLLDEYTVILRESGGGHVSESFIRDSVNTVRSQIMALPKEQRISTLKQAIETAKPRLRK